MEVKRATIKNVTLAVIEDPKYFVADDVLG